jgi:flagellar basal-body rod protein FlgG
MPDGTTGYTRDGSFQVSAQGQLVTNNGYRVQPGITIPATAQSVTIAHRRHGQRHAARPGAAAVGRADPARQLRQPGRPGTQGPEPLRRDGRLGRAATGAPGSNRLGTVQQGFVETATSTSSRSWWR